jgi:hypothetical protein
MAKKIKKPKPVKPVIATLANGEPRPEPRG